MIIPKVKKSCSYFKKLRPVFLVLNNYPFRICLPSIYFWENVKNDLNLLHSFLNPRSTSHVFVLLEMTVSHIIVSLNSNI